MKIKVTDDRIGAVKLGSRWFAQWSAEEGLAWRTEIKGVQGDEPTEAEIGEAIRLAEVEELQGATKRYKKKEASLGECVMAVLARYISTNTAPADFGCFINDVQQAYAEKIAAVSGELASIKEAVNEKELTKQEALSFAEFFPKWGVDFGEGKQLAVGYKFVFGGKLFEVRQAHNVVGAYFPGNGTEALYKEVVPTEEEGGAADLGTLGNPIHYDGNMELFSGKYYEQEGMVYLCNRDSQQPMYHQLSALVGMYVEVVNS